MITITAETDKDGVIHPVGGFPSGALMVVFNGQDYLAYMPGDALPAVDVGA